jgi:hypothetical protein
MPFDDFLDNGEAHPGAIKPFLSIQLLEYYKHKVKVIAVDAYSVIFDRKNPFIPRSFG